MNDTSESTQTLEPVTRTVKPPARTQRTTSVQHSPAVHEPHHSVRHLADDHDEDEGFFERHRGKLIAITVVVIGGSITYAAMTAEKSTIRRAPESKVVQISLPPPPVAPPPPPPPPKVLPPPKEEKMMEAKPVEDTPKPVEKPAEDAPIGTAIKGNGPGDGLALGKGGGGGSGRIGGGDGQGAKAFDIYASRVGKSVADRLRANAKTRTASVNRVKVRIWVDNTGRVTDAKIASGSGNADVDAGIISALAGSQVGPPPDKMPMPIVMLVSADRR